MSDDDRVVYAIAWECHICKKRFFVDLDDPIPVDKIEVATGVEKRIMVCDGCYDELETAGTLLPAPEEEQP